MQGVLQSCTFTPHRVLGWDSSDPPPQSRAPPPPTRKVFVDITPPSHTRLLDRDCRQIPQEQMGPAVAAAQALQSSSTAPWPIYTPATASRQCPCSLSSCCGQRHLRWLRAQCHALPGRLITSPTSECLQSSVYARSCLCSTASAIKHTDSSDQFLLPLSCDRPALGSCISASGSLLKVVWGGCSCSRTPQRRDGVVSVASAATLLPLSVSPHVSPSTQLSDACMYVLYVCMCTCSCACPQGGHAACAVRGTAV